MKKMTKHKMLILIIFLLTAIALMGCANPNDDSDNASIDAPFSYTETDDFILKLSALGNTYRTGDTITIWAEFEYLGENDSITIYHSIPYLVFQIIGDNGFEMLPMRVDVLESSALALGETYHFEFQKNGSWSSDDEDASFWEDFFDDPDLILPPGIYTITAIAEFSLSSENVIDSQITLSTEISIIVQE